MIYGRAINVDFVKSTVNDAIYLHEGDVNGSGLLINVFNDGQAFNFNGCTVTYDAVIENFLAECDATATVTANTITVPITRNMTAKNGTLRIDVKIIKGNDIVFLQTFEALVRRRVVQGQEIIDLSGTTIGEKLQALDEIWNFMSFDYEKVVEVLDNALDTAVDTKTLYIHKVTSGSSTYVKGTVRCTGSNNGFTQFRFRRSGGIEYRTYSNSSWGGYTANGDWIRLATKDEIPDTTEGWKNKTYISHGDSITYQDGRPYEDGGANARGYQTILKEQLALGTHTNMGVDAATMALRNNAGGVNTIKSVASYASYDICTIAYGTNDFRWSIPLGTLGKIGDSNFDLTTFFGAYREAIEYILTSKPSIQLVLMTPLQRNRGGYDVNTVNSVGLRLIDYVNAVKQLGQLYGIPVSDMYSTSGFTQLTFSTYTVHNLDYPNGDGLHPNDDGYDRMGKLLARFFKSGFGTNDIEDLSDYVKEEDVYLADEADDTFIKLPSINIVVNPSQGGATNIPSGQFFKYSGDLYFKCGTGANDYFKVAKFTDIPDISGKVDKEAGKGLSTNDYTTAEKNKLSGIETGANKTTVDSVLSSSSKNPVQNKIVKAGIDGISQVPSGGSTGQVLTKTANGYAWQSLPLYNGGVQ